jgi:hypothetical protein
MIQNVELGDSLGFTVYIHMLFWGDPSLDSRRRHILGVIWMYGTELVKLVDLIEGQTHRLKAELRSDALASGGYIQT